MKREIIAVSITPVHGAGPQFNPDMLPPWLDNCRR